jgi:hypothetical protein
MHLTRNKSLSSEIDYGRSSLCFGQCSQFVMGEQCHKCDSAGAMLDLPHICSLSECNQLPFGRQRTESKPPTLKKRVTGINYFRKYKIIASEIQIKKRKGIHGQTLFAGGN